MKLIIRSLELSDFDECWDTLIGREALPHGAKQGIYHAWKSLLNSRAMEGFIIYDVAVSPGRVIAFGAIVFVAKEWLENHLKKPTPYQGYRLLLEHEYPNSPILNVPRIARDNAGDGLSVFAVQNGYRQDFSLESTPELKYWLIKVTFRVHLGFNIRVVAGETYGWAMTEFCQQGDNWRYVSDFAEFFRDRKLPLPAPDAHPYLLMSSRDKAFVGLGIWPLFQFFPPELGLTRLQQRVLEPACEGASRPEIAAKLGVERETVRNAFRDALKKARAHPKIGQLFIDTEGKLFDARKQEDILLAYLADHFEELKPWPRRRSRNKALASSGESS